MFTKEMMDDLANKLLFDLTEDENKLLLSEFDVINENMEIISNIKGISEIEPMHYPREFILDNLRSDDDVRCIPTSDALKNSDDTLEDVNCVPKVVG